MLRKSRKEVITNFSDRYDIGGNDSSGDLPIDADNELIQKKSVVRARFFTKWTILALVIIVALIFFIILSNN